MWLLSVPPGAGLATLKAGLRLCLGVSPERSGVCSAGNGPAMRSPLIGVCYGDNLDKLRQLVRVSTRITHTDPRAEHGALAVALAAHCSRCGVDAPDVYLRLARQAIGEDGIELLALLEKAAESASRSESPDAFAASLGRDNGVSGYIFSTVPVAVQAWLRYPRDYRSAVLSVIRCGGDTDTTAAITGAVVGAGVGRHGIPDDWLRGLMEWPRGTMWMEMLGARLAEVVESGAAQRPMPVIRPAVVFRNLFFLAVVLAHGFRRLLPPY